SDRAELRSSHRCALRPSDCPSDRVDPGQDPRLRRALHACRDHRDHPLGELAPMKTRTALLLTSTLLLSSVSAYAREPLDDRWSLVPSPPVPDPVPFVVPAGLYYVTDTYLADVVATSDATTVYSTTTVHESTGTYARVVDVVGTGASSPFDGVAFNRRGALTDGQALAGTYYENFVLTASGYVPV